MLDDKMHIQNEIPANSVSCFIGRVVNGDDLAENGTIIVDLYDLDGSVNGPEYGKSGSTQKKAIASWTLWSAARSWEYPPNLYYKGSLHLCGNIATEKATIVMNNATLSDVNISGGTPMNGTATIPGTPPIDGTATIPVNISGASGTSNIELKGQAKIEVAQQDITLNLFTDKDGNEGTDLKDKSDYGIQLIAKKSQQSPWCTNLKGKECDDPNYINESDRPHFAMAGDKALCLAFGNSTENLYVIDLIRGEK